LLKESHVAPQIKVSAGVVPHAKVGEIPPSMIQVEAQYIADLLAQHNGHRRTVADILGISERTLYRKLNLYQL